MYDPIPLKTRKIHNFVYLYFLLPIETELLLCIRLRTQRQVVRKESNEKFHMTQKVRSKALFLLLSIIARETLRTVCPLIKQVGE